jgi:hypothetical protein
MQQEVPGGSVAKFDLKARQQAVARLAALNAELAALHRVFPHPYPPQSVAQVTAGER